MVFPMGEFFLQSGLSHPRRFTELKMSVVEKCFASCGRFFLYSSFLYVDSPCVQQVTIGKKAPQMDTGKKKV